MRKVLCDIFRCLRFTFGFPQQVCFTFYLEMQAQKLKPLNQRVVACEGPEIEV